jgi:hypothetical protein
MSSSVPYLLLDHVSNFLGPLFEHDLVPTLDEQTRFGLGA